MSNPQIYSSKALRNVDFSFTDRTDWGFGYVADMQIETTGTATLNGWMLSFDLPDTITQIWGGTIISHVGNHYVIGNVDYDAHVSAGNPALLGWVASGPSSAAPTHVVLNGRPLSLPAAVATPSATTSSATATSATAAPAVAAPAAAAPAPPLPVANVEAATISTTQTGESFAAAGPGTLLPQGYLSTAGSHIVDASGTNVSLNAVNWFGLESTSFAPQGLDVVNYKATMQEMVRLGFNAIRIPFSLQALNPSSMPTNIDYTLNPDLKGLNAQGVLDKIVDEAGTLGLKIILDNHRSAAGGGPNDNGLWYDSGYSQADFTNSWVSLASHYAGNSTVSGFDLYNEPHDPTTWGDGNAATDWQMAATNTGNAIQAVNPNALIIVEGTQSTNGIWTAYGENLIGVAQHPVTLDHGGKLVYSAHDYPVSVTGESYFNDPDYPANLAAIWTRDWGYIQQQNIAPVWIGEFGSKLTTSSDQTWLSTFVNYITGNAAAGTGGAPVSQTPFSWAYWSWNPDSLDTGGILLGDWATPEQAKLAAIAPALWHPSPATSSDATFTVDLSAPSASPVTLHVQTMDGTAHAGTDYTALSQDVTIAAGATKADVTVHLLQPASTSSVFFLKVTDASGAAIGTGQNSATIPAQAAPAASAATTSAEPAAPGPAPMSATVKLDSTNDWGSGLVAYLKVLNTGNVVANSWQIEIDTTEDITNLWNGKILSHVGSTYIVGNADYNGTLIPGIATAIGLQAVHMVPGETLTAHMVKMQA